MKKTHVVIHCSDSAWGDVRAITAWHTQPPPRGRGWSAIGYAYVVLNGRRRPRQFDPADVGVIEMGRDLDRDGDVEDEVGSHTLGLNRQSIGVCLVGPTFETRQIERAARLVADICTRHGIPVKNVIGHNEHPSGRHKKCPVIDMNLFRQDVARIMAEATGE